MNLLIYMNDSSHIIRFITSSMYEPGVNWKEAYLYKFATVENCEVYDYVHYPVLENVTRLNVISTGDAVYLKDNSIYHIYHPTGYYKVDCRSIYEKIDKRIPLQDGLNYNYVYFYYRKKTILYDWLTGETKIVPHKKDWYAGVIGYGAYCMVEIINIHENTFYFHLNDHEYIVKGVGFPLLVNANANLSKIYILENGDKLNIKVLKINPDHSFGITNIKIEQKIRYIKYIEDDCFSLQGEIYKVVDDTLVGMGSMPAFKSKLPCKIWKGETVIGGCNKYFGYVQHMNEFYFLFNPLLKKLNKVGFEQSMI